MDRRRERPDTFEGEGPGRRRYAEVVILEQLLSRTARIERQLRILIRAVLQGDAMAKEDLDRLKTSVERNTTVAQSAVTLINGLAQQIRDAADDPEELRAMADKLDADATGLSEAVTANTPAQA